MRIDLDRLFTDKDWTNEEHKPFSSGVFIPGKRGRIFSYLSIPGGAGPHPTVIFCHGMPGNEKLMDYAEMLRHIGFCTITFHYSGSWGSDGNYSFGNCFEDGSSVLQYVLNNQDGHFDTDHVYVVGHSVGGLLGTHLLARHPEFKSGVLITPCNIGAMYADSKMSEQHEALYRAAIEDTTAWLNGYTWAAFLAEMNTGFDRFTLESYGEALAKKPVLAIAASMDFGLPREMHIDRLTDAIKAFGAPLLTEQTFPTNHEMSDQRYGIARTIAQWLAAQIA